MLNAILLAALQGAGAPGQASIEVGPNVHVSAARKDLPHHEVVLAASPRDAHRLLAGSMLLGQGVHSAAYVSADGGGTWSAPVLADEAFANDPTCAFGPDGAAYLLVKTATRLPRRNADWDALFVRRSADGGATWEPVIHGIPCVDRPFLAVDGTDGPYRGRVYVAFNHRIYGETATSLVPDEFRNTIRLATSLDGGRTFAHRCDRLLLGQGDGRIAASMVGAVAVLPDGTVAVLHTRAVMAGRNPATGKLRVESARLQLFLSRDGGESLEPALPIADIESSYNLANSRGTSGCMAVAAGEGSAARICVLWADVRSGRSAILASSSADGGRTWSAPAPVDDAAPRAGRGPDDFMPAVAANRDGVLGATWYDRRDHADNAGYDVRFSASLDGGTTWLQSRRVSEQPNTVPTGGTRQAGFNLTGGDTAGLAAARDGAFHALWVDNRTGVQQVWTARIVVRR